MSAQAQRVCKGLAQRLQVARVTMLSFGWRAPTLTSTTVVVSCSPTKKIAKGVEVG